MAAAVETKPFPSGNPLGGDSKMKPAKERKPQNGTSPALPNWTERERQSLLATDPTFFRIDTSHLERLLNLGEASATNWMHRRHHI